MTLSIYNITPDDFLKSIKTNTISYACISDFWIPVIEKRSKLLSGSAENCLLNPIFLWSYLGVSEKLERVEQEMQKLRRILGHQAFSEYQSNLQRDISSHSVENNAHNRMLDRYSEIHGMSYYHDLGYSICLEESARNQRRQDFNACSNNCHIAVEAKSIRLPDKLLLYLMRWWHAQSEISSNRPLGVFPYIKFRWQPIGRHDLNAAEILQMNQFFQEVCEAPDSDRELNAGRIAISYSPSNGLKPALIPLGTLAENAEHPIDQLKDKIDRVIQGALQQLSYAKTCGKKIACYLEGNIDPRTLFEHENEYSKTMERLKEHYQREEQLTIVFVEKGYL